MPEEKLASRWLVSTDWLSQHLSDPNVIVLDGSYYLANAEARCRRRNISPAIFRARCASTSTRSRTIPIPCPTCCRRRSSSPHQVGALGIGDGMTIVVYDGLGLYGAPRVWWTFRTFGAAERVHARRRHAEMEGREPPARNRRSEAARREDLHAAIQPRHGRLDRRRAEGACSTRPRRWSMRAPPIASAARRRSRARACAAATCRARSTCRSATVLKDGRLESHDEHRRRVCKGAASTSTARSITSCGSGVTAAILTFALEALGKQPGRGL